MVLWERARVEVFLSKYFEAEKTLQNLLLLNAGNSEAKSMLELVHLRMKENQDADAVFTKSNDPHSKTEIQKSSDPFADLAGKIQSSSYSNSLTVKEKAKPGIPAGNFRSPRTAFYKDEFLAYVSHSSDRGFEYRPLSYGFEFLKKYSSKVSTTSSFDVQGRFVFRNQFRQVTKEMVNEDPPGVFFEHHNVYWDFYNALDLFMGAGGRSKNLGRYNFRLGRFYLPFGLNLQSDTHGTVLQLSNERNFGFERDWYAGFWGGLNKDLNYDLYYMLGSGYDLLYKRQKGLFAGRLSLSNRFLYNDGLEGGLALISGERLAMEPGKTIDTLRVGIDGRLTRAIPGGKLTTTGEFSTGDDDYQRIFTQLYQLEFLRRDRKFGMATQYRSFWQDKNSSIKLPNGLFQGKTDNSLFGELTWYFRNLIDNSKLEWIKLNVERKFQSQTTPPETITTLQYYKYG